MKRLIAGTFLFVLGSLLAAPAMAAQITVLSAHGNWNNATYTSTTSGVGTIVNGDPTSSINWGGTVAVSGYDFTKIIPGPQTLPPAPTPLFPMGTFVHRNKDLTVNGNGFRTLRTVQLDVVLTLSVDGTPVGPLTFTFNFTHDETTNTSSLSQCDPTKLNPTSTVPCPDVVTFAASPAPTTFKVGGVDYTLAMSFVDNQGKPIARFITEEQQDNVANLVGQFNTPASGGGTNQPPTVNAGPDQTIILPSLATLSGTASDDGLPNNILTVNWTKVSGPGTVTFGNAQSLATTAAFSAIGNYVLRLTASDTLLTASDDMTVFVGSSTTPPPPPPPPPAPILNSITPNTMPAGSPAFTLTANGSQFVSGAAVIWNGSPRTTTFINSTQLSAAILATDVASAGSATVLVANPDLQSSGVLPFTITSGNGGGNPPTITLSANPGTITTGGSSTLNWTITNATSAVLDQGIGAISSTSGSTSVSPANTRTYTLTAWGNGGRSSAQVTVTVKSVSGGPIPTISFQASPASILTGGSSTLSWTIANATSAVIDQSIGSISPTSGTQLVSPGNTVTYTLIAWGPGGSNIAQVTVTVNPNTGGGPLPTIAFSANPTTISAGNSSTLNWTISNATSAVIDQNIGAVSLTSGSKAVSPANTTTYTLTACGNGCVSALVTVTVNTNGGGNNPPAISFTANPTTLNLGDSSMLTWTISNATSAVIDTGIGPISITSGSRLVTPIATRTFTLTAWGAGGSRSAQVTLTVTGTGSNPGAGSTDLSNAKAYPVPYKAKQSTIGGILFNGLSTGSRIRIFTTDGHLVQTLYADDKILWPVTNKHDEKVASGVYFYRIDNGAGQVKEGKLVIIQ